jgi:hypothetical protein
MKRLARCARAWALLAIALLAIAAPAPVRAQEPPPEASSVAQPERAKPTSSERRTGRRALIRPGAAQGSAHLTRSEQRALRRHLLRLTPSERERFLRDWERKSPLEQRAAIREERQRRRAQELPERLRTPEMRERLEGMSLEERRRFFQHARKWRDMKPSERHELRARLERFGALDEAAQRALIDEKFRRRSPEAREKILRDLQDAARRLKARAPEARAVPEPPPASE